MRSVIRIVCLLPVVKVGFIVEHTSFKEHAVGQPSEEDEEGWDEPEFPEFMRNDGNEDHYDKEREPGPLGCGVPHYYFVKELIINNLIDLSLNEQ